MANNPETLLRMENQQEVAEIMEFLRELAPEEKEYFLVFMQGIRFAKRNSNVQIATAV